MTDYYIGTAGWSYKDWEGVVYPERKSSDFHALVYLAKYMNTVEINSTFYRPPVLRVTLSWIKRVKDYPDFLFTLKLHQIFTHGDRVFNQKDVDEFKLGLEPLRVDERLAAILLQFPWSFVNSIQNMEHLIKLFQTFRDYPLALEVRHGTWDDPKFLQLLQEHQVGFCNIDQPLINNSLKPSAHTTHPEFSYARLHGRNYTNWFKQNAGRDARYNYLYSDQELDEWVDRIQTLGQKSKKVFVITNNHYQGQALANALQIKNKITGEKVDIPVELLKRYPILKEIVKKLEKGQLDLFGEE
jgi:uncharacterized protein YecE (DUF72 family)